MRDEPLSESWELLRYLALEYPGILTIGGWASWLHTRGQLTHDVDVVVPFEALQAMRVREAEGLTTSTHVGGRKYRLEYGEETHADIYVPFQSRLGARLDLPVERLLSYSEVIDGILTVTREALLVTKMAALLDRSDTLPGMKDREDMVALLQLPDPVDWEAIVDIVGRSPDDATRRELAREALALLRETPLANRAERLALRDSTAAGLAAIESAVGGPEPPSAQVDRRVTVLADDEPAPPPPDHGAPAMRPRTNAP